MRPKQSQSGDGFIRSDHQPIIERCFTIAMLGVSVEGFGEKLSCGICRIGFKY